MNALELALIEFPWGACGLLVLKLLFDLLMVRNLVAPGWNPAVVIVLGTRLPFSHSRQRRFQARPERCEFYGCELILDLLLAKVSEGVLDL